MKRIKIRHLVAAACCILANSAGAQATKVLTAEKSNEYGIVYSLPQTALKVEVTATHTVAKKGPYYLYARKSIGAQDVVMEDSEKWVISDVKVTPYGVPDSSTQYLMQLKPGATTFVAVDADGMLLSINKEVQPSGAHAPLQPADPDTRWPSGREYLDFVDEDFVASQSPARQAQLLAESLMEVRESKLALTRGTAETMPTDGKQMELMLQSLAQQESALAAAFTGTVTSEKVTRSFSFVPDGECSQILFGCLTSPDLSNPTISRAMPYISA